MEQITREEMIRMAVETRKKVTAVVVTPEQLEEYPVTLEHLAIPTRVGDALAYFAYCGEKEKVTPLVINMHGGGFIRSRTESDELFCRKLVHALECKTLDLDYRVAPEFPFPTGLHECYDVVKWAFEHAAELGADPGKIILMGHSAGGNLVAGITMMALESKEFMPALNVMDYPPLDLYTEPGDKPQRGKSVPAERARLYNLYYCERELQNNYLASPYYATEEQVTGFPATLVITAGEDSLCTEAEEFALKVARAGSEVTMKRFLGCGHGFTIYGMPGAEEAFALIEKFVKTGLKA